VTAAETEGRYLETLVRHIGDGDVLAAYARSDGLCVPHLFAAVETSGYPEAAAPTRAFGTLAGAKSVFGNDVHPRPRCPEP
jgi:hypothetical protein